MTVRCFGAEITWPARWVYVAEVRPDPDGPDELEFIVLEDRLEIMMGVPWPPEPHWMTQANCLLPTEALVELDQRVEREIVQMATASPSQS